jgi:RNA polymerase sigma-70 factor (ECF subfamily)|tara:strand:- start:1616 stop:2206 length:591 start_codon:yes stop_codon:yes gene_type:complete
LKFNYVENVKVVYLKAQPPVTVSEQDDNSSLYALVREHESALRRFIRVRARVSTHEIEDILQEMYAKLFSMEGLAAKSEERQDTFRSFLFTVVANLIIDRERRAKVRARDAHESFSEADHGEKDHGPEKQAGIFEKLSEIEHVLNGINPYHKSAFILCRVEGKSYREISDTLGVSVSTVEKYIAAALTAIRNKVLD